VKKWYNYPKFIAEARCRFCIHPAYWHLEIKNFGMDNQMGRWDKCSTPRSINLCKCPGYAPEDNLEFLEYKHEESSSL
jgi:hypothetical protein